MTSILKELAPDTLVAMRKVGREYVAETVTGMDLTDHIRKFVRKQAYDANQALRFVPTKKGGYQWRKAPMADYLSLKKTSIPTHTATAETVTEVPTDHAEVVDFLTKAYSLKPTNLIINEVKWRYLVRSVLRSKNIMLTGPSGCGKTLAVQSVHKVLGDRPYFYFNLGAMQDPRTSLIGNTHFKKEEGTFFSKSLFIEAIQTPKAIILCDEISRAHPDAANILLTVFDENQRYLRIDEKEDTPTIKVAEGVSFLATANIGTEYTATRVMDRALLDRFIRVEMEPLKLDDEKQLLHQLFPSVDTTTLDKIAEIACDTRDNVRSEDRKISDIISTRMTVEMAGIIYDGFSLAEAAEVCIYPFYPNQGGTDSERTFMQQLVQKHLPTEFDNKQTPWQQGDAASKIPFDVN